MSTPALSRRLAGLEKELGVRLFDRRPRGVVLTRAGSAYLAHAAAVLDRLQAAAAELRQNGAVVRVTTIPAFATRWLLPRLAAFTERHPEIEVDVRTSMAFERLDGGDYDLAVRLAPDNQMSAPPLLPIHLMPVWSTAHPRAIEHPRQVLTHPLLGPSHRPEFWREWLEHAELDPEAVRPRDVDTLLLYERTLSGSGVAIGIEPISSGLLDEGRLQGLKTHRFRSARSFFLVEDEAAQTPSTRLLSRWLREAARGG